VTSPAVRDCTECSSAGSVHGSFCEVCLADEWQEALELNERTSLPPAAADLPPAAPVSDATETRGPVPVPLPRPHRSVSRT
jgi:hypothetical protein